MAALDETRLPSKGTDWTSLTLAPAAALAADAVLRHLESTTDGLSREEAEARLARIGPNALRSHGARPFAVLVRQLRNPLLVLLVAAALTSFAVGERTSALIIGMSVGLGFFNEYRSELADEALHSQLRHTAFAVRDLRRSTAPRTREGVGRLPRRRSSCRARCARAADICARCRAGMGRSADRQRADQGRGAASRTRRPARVLERGSRGTWVAGASPAARPRRSGSVGAVMRTKGRRERSRLPRRAERAPRRLVTGRVRGCSLVLARPRQGGSHGSRTR
jgi:Cation transporter/ATPase, N-terminus